MNEGIAIYAPKRSETQGDANGLTMRITAVARASSLMEGDADRETVSHL